MKKRVLSFLSVALPIAVVVFALSAGAAWGNCTTPRPHLFLQGNGGCPSALGYCYIQSPGVGTVASIESDFWAFTFGSPVDGSGDDNGTWEDDQNYPSFSWIRCYAGDCATYGKYMTGSWDQDPKIDGCIDGKIAPGKTAELMVAAFSDENAAGTEGYFAVAAALRTETPGKNYDFANFGGRHIDLVAIPAPSITASCCGSGCTPGGGSTGACDIVRLQVSCGDLSAGFYSDNSVTFEEVVQGCQVHSQSVGEDGDPPADRLRTSGWSDTGVLIPSGGSDVVELSCPTTTDNVFLAHAVALDSGFLSGHVSANSTRIECGPTLAEPPDVKFKVVPRPDKPKVRPRRK